jgi:murein DD-endopeptidase MepM/ murein hydrolase activator NlpD
MITKRTISLLLCASLPVGATLAAIPFLNTKPASAVSGQYIGLKLPYPNGQKKAVTGTHDRKNGRHALDFGMNSEDVLAIRGGKVYRATWDSSGGGNMLIIDHGDNYCSVYLHLNKFYVSVNEQVGQGQRIAQSGNTGTLPGGKTMPPHLHVSVTQKLNGSCSANQSQEIAMIFDEKKGSELNYPESIVSQNGVPFASTPYLPESRVSISGELVNLNVKASNLKDKTVYVSMWRDRYGTQAPASWSYQKKATGTSVDIGLGKIYSGVDYYVVASLTPIPKDEAARPPRSACYSTTGGLQLCNKVRR